MRESLLQFDRERHVSPSNNEKNERDQNYASCSSNSQFKDLQLNHILARHLSFCSSKGGDNLNTHKIGNTFSGEEITPNHLNYLMDQQKPKAVCKKIINMTRNLFCHLLLLPGQLLSFYIHGQEHFRIPWRKLNRFSPLESPFLFTLLSYNITDQSCG